ncbi:MAG: DNA processing protein [Motiliproteus sp.]|jgi:DNA processing protein
MPSHYLHLQRSQSLWLQLSQISGLGPVTLRRLWQHFGSAEAIVQASAGDLAELGLRRTLIDALTRRPQQSAIKSRDEGGVEARVDAWLALSNHHLLTLDDPGYPAALRQIADPPALLYLIGDAEVLNVPQIALVGSRNASAQGLENAYAYGRYLSEKGLVPTSGLALGIDAAAHAGGLDGLGLTVAVLGTGVDRVYPFRHQALAHRIVAKGGVLVSELALGTPPLAQNFPRRNRIISALSLGVVVVEAAYRSGSLITARQALEQGREVFALPGSIHNPLSKGCHSLIRQGALLVDSAEQILEELAPQLDAGCLAALGQAGSGSPAASPGLSSALALARLSTLEQQLLQAIGYEATSMDRLMLRSGLTITQVQAQLLSLELQGWVAAVPGGYQRTSQR